jgi:hypothetical protein
VIGGFRNRLTYANVMATVAVFLALGGGAWAALTLPKNSVKSRQIKNGQVKAQDLGKGAVVPAKLGNVEFAQVLAEESTSSDSNVNLTTPGPTITITLTKASPVTVYGYAQGHGSDAGTTCGAGIIGQTGSGFAFGSEQAVFPGVFSFQERRMSFTGAVQPGTTEFTMLYRRVTGTGSCAFKNRQLWVELSNSG